MEIFYEKNTFHIPHSTFHILILTIVLASFTFTGCVFSVKSEDLLGRHFTWTNKTSETQENYAEEVYEFYEDGTYKEVYFDYTGFRPAYYVSTGTYTTESIIELTEIDGYCYLFDNDTKELKKEPISNYTPPSLTRKFKLKKDEYGNPVLVVTYSKVEYIGYKASEKLKY